jgi:pyruvate dehydrogenase E2 component (dihydrolipoamide acetyltransferase)
MEAPSSTDLLRLPPAPRPARRLELPSGAISYLTLGNKNAARTVIFLHGFGGNLLSWQYNITAFSDAPRVVALDLPGHGGSDLPHTIEDINAIADWIMSALDKLEIEYGHFIGHSLGGWAALTLARRHPERVTALSLLSPAGMGRKLDASLMRKLLAEGDPQAFARAIMWLSSGSSNSLPNFESAMLGQLDIPNARRCLSEIFERVVAPAFDESLPPFDWSDIRAPVQLIWGANDDVLAPPSHLHGLPSALTLVSDAGHMSHLQQPAEINRLLNEFVAKISKSKT